VGVAPADGNVRVIGRYALYAPLAAGGMATVHFGRLLGPVGFSRTVAIKRLHGQYAQDPEFVSMFLDEARLAARIRHPNVVPTLDVVATDGELFLVMDYVAGESLARLARTMIELGTRMPLRMVSSIMAGVLHGLHAAHEAKDERGMPLGIVHRDVSPQNVLVGTDGVSKILDFGVAKAAGRVQTTRDGQIKGKLAYMPPEQLRGVSVSRATDIYAAGVVLWELVAGQRLFSGDNEGVVVAKVLQGDVASPAEVLRAKGVRLTPEQEHALPRLEKLIFRAVSADPEARFSTAKEMALELERAVPPATASEVGDWVEANAHEILTQRADRVAEIESSASMMPLEARPSTRMPTAPPVSAATRSLEVTRADVLTPVSQTSAPFDVPPPVTQPSSISVVTAGSIPVRTNGWFAVLLAGGLALLLIATVIVWRAVQSPDPSAKLPNSPPHGATSPPEPPPPLVLLTPDASAPGVVSASSVVSAPTAGPTALPSATAKKPQVRPPQPPQPNCTPPYTTDPAGIRHYKPGCV